MNGEFEFNELPEDRTQSDVYISRKGKYYYPDWCKQATIEISLEEAKARGYTPSKSYEKYLEDLNEDIDKTYLHEI